MLPLNRFNVQEKSVSIDKVFNTYDNRLLEWCKSVNMYIVNGQFDNDALQGKATCYNVSVLGYVICSPSIFTYTDSFIVQYYDPMLCDIHCAVNTTFKYKNSIAIFQNNDHVTQPTDCTTLLMNFNSRWTILIFLTSLSNFIIKVRIRSVL